jgi:AmmeMemoRadiSam system protein B
MLASERPQLRPHLKAARDDSDPHSIYVWDELGLSEQPQRITRSEFDWLQLFDGNHTLRDMQVAATRQTGGRLVPLERFATLAARMDAALFLEGPRYRQAAHASIRPPRCLGSYERDPGALCRQLARLFTRPHGPGLPGKPADGRLAAALVPHIDYPRGGVTYAWGFKEICEHTDASLFVIIGTSHFSAERFTLTRKDFQTPLGIAPTDQQYIDRLVQHYGDGLFDDELLAHLPEHSIELEVVFLQYLFQHAANRPFRIVPLVVGSFQDCVGDGTAPAEQEDIGRMVEALRGVAAETSEPICYLISGDLAHLGPKFGDPEPVAIPALSHSRERDYALLRQAETADALGYFRLIAEEGDVRRICGLPPTYLVLEALRPGHGRLLHYDQYVHPRGFESVSFASMAFYR